MYSEIYPIHQSKILCDLCIKGFCSKIQQFVQKRVALAPLSHRMVIPFTTTIKKSQIFKNFCELFHTNHSAFYTAKISFVTFVVKIQWFVLKGVASPPLVHSRGTPFKDDPKKSLIFNLICSEIYPIHQSKISCDLGVKIFSPYCGQ